MTDLQVFLKDRDLELTLFNEQEDVQFIGKATTVKALRGGKYLLRFQTHLTFKNVSPFSLATLHSNRKIFTTLIIKPVRPEHDSTVVEVVY